MYKHMSVLDNFQTRVEFANGNAGLTENTLPLLHEIRHALQRLSESEEPTVIDLRAIPFGPGDEEQLLAFLGEGEVTAVLNALGDTRVNESRFPGVWLVDHRNTEGERIAFQIEITDIPAVLCAQPEDLSDSLEKLDQALNEDCQEQ
jgi:hydrogenase-1 operon protein HyaF